MSAPSVATCPTCGAAASGRFCAECGSSLGGATCADCRATLTPGAKFCHRCGTPVGERSPVASERGLAGALPWAVAAIALLALVALIAGQRIARARPQAQTTAVAGEGTEVPSAIAGDVTRAPAPAPDISSLSPEQRAERLFNRIMTSFEAGDTARVQFFAPMALQAYQQLPRMTLDDRYHLGRIGAVTGIGQLAAAQADTILRERPTHLLGLVLAAQAARMRGDEAAARAFDKRLLAAQSSELKRQIPEYGQHANDISRAVDGAKLRGL